MEIIVKVINIFDYEETILAIEELNNKINGLIITAIDEKHINAKIKIICVDYSLAIEEGLQKGQILATITQHPYTQGYKAMEAMFDYIIKKKNPKPRIILDNSIILKESIIVHKIDS